MQRNKVSSTITTTPMLQWASGKTQYTTPATRTRQNLVGWHVELGQVAAFDTLCEVSGIPQITIYHQREGGTEAKPHWSFGESLLLLPITAGPRAATLKAMIAQREVIAREDGIVASWPEGGRSSLTIWGLIRDPRFGANDAPLVRLVTRSHMTDSLMNALLAHTAMCERLDGQIDRTRHPEPVYFWEYALPLVSAPDEITVGKGNLSATIVPFIADHPSDDVPLEKEMIAAYWTPSALAERARGLYDTVCSEASLVIQADADRLAVASS